MTPAAALSERDRRLVTGLGLAAVAASVLVSLPASHPAGAVYPPHAWLLLVPFAAMPYAAAAALWSALNLFCIFRAAELLGARRDLAFIACLSPAALMMLAAGHAGGFLALMAVAAVVQSQTHPARAGLCLALMTVEPQLALLLAALLPLLGYWRALLSAIPWTFALLAASAITFGSQPWAEFFAAQAAGPDGSMPAISLYAGADMLGLPDWAAQAAHWGFGFAALAGATVVFLRGGPQPRSIALLLLAVILALPQARSDLLAIAAPALTFALFAADDAHKCAFLPFAAALLLWAAPAVAPLLAGGFGAIVPMVLAAFLLFALVRELGWRPGIGAHEIMDRCVETERRGAP